MFAIVFFWFDIMRQCAIDFFLITSRIKSNGGAKNSGGGAGGCHKLSSRKAESFEFLKQESLAGIFFKFSTYNL